MYKEKDEIEVKIYYEDKNLSKVEKLLKSSSDIVEFELEKKNILESKYLYIPLVVVIFLTTFLTLNIFAEQIGSSPESGTDSKFTQLYDDLVTLGIGTEGSGYWGDWGSRWNRVMSVSTKEYTPYIQQALEQRDDRDLTDWGEGGTWTQTNTTSGSEVWKDEITELYWSSVIASTSNVYTRSTCNFYSTVPRGNYDGSDTDCGNAINMCATLQLDGDGDEVDDTGWYLPSEKELLQGHIHGIYKKTNVTWATANQFWSSTDSGWTVLLTEGWNRYYSKSNSYSVRCVLRSAN